MCKYVCTRCLFGVPPTDKQKGGGAKRVHFKEIGKQTRENLDKSLDDWGLELEKVLIGKFVEFEDS